MSFENILGQDIAIRALKNMIAQDQVRGSYLFLGPDGVGKRRTAIEFAKVVNCTDETDVSCSCSSCKKIITMNHPDVFMVNPEGDALSIKIGRIREIIYQASLKPYEGKKRIFIINDVEAMTEEAQNAILRLLEEPPQNHILILTASNIAGLVSTIPSRCKIFRFYSLSQDNIYRFLRLRDFDDEEAILFSHMAMGSIGRAVAFKEKDIRTRRDKVLNDFFLRKGVLLRENVLNEEVSEDIEENLYIFLCWYRDLLVAKWTKERSRLLNIDRYEEIFSYAGRFSKDRLEQALLTIIKTIENVRGNINPKIALFNMAVELQLYA